MRQREATFGPNDSNTFGTRDSLARAYAATGRPEEALALREATFKAAEATLGPTHLITSTLRHNLAIGYMASHVDKAIPLLEATLKQSEAKYGPEHRSTNQSRNVLVQAYLKIGRQAEADKLYAATLKEKESRLGANHFETLAFRETLANYYIMYEGRVAEASTLRVGTLKLAESKLGPNHVMTTAESEQLAGFYLTADRAGEAIPLYEAVLKTYEMGRGTDDRETHAIRTSLLDATWTLAASTGDHAAQEGPEGEVQRQRGALRQWAHHLEGRYTDRAR